MSAEANKDLYRRWLFEVWGAGDYDVAAQIIAADLADHTAYPGQPPGRAGDVWAAKQVRTAFPDLSFELVVVLADEDYVSGRWTMTGTHTGVLDMMGIPPTGRPVEMGGQEIFRVRDGQLAEVWHVEELPRMLEALHLGPPPPSVLKTIARVSAWQYRREQRKR
jgi:predicted ester cyclase